MRKTSFKAGNMLYPVPAVMVTVRDHSGKDNVLTVAWTGTVCTNPPMLSISVRPSRYSYGMLCETGEFVVNLVSRELTKAADYCGVRSGRDVDKFEQMKLTKEKADFVNVPMIAQSPVCIECRVKEKIPLGSHDMFLADILAVHVFQDLLDEKEGLHLEKAGLIAYSHGDYVSLGETEGSFGFSVKKRKSRKKKNSLHSKT